MEFADTPNTSLELRPMTMASSVVTAAICYSKPPTPCEKGLPMFVGYKLPQRPQGFRALSPEGLRRILRGRDGSAILEMAFGLPILFMVLTGVFWTSISLYQKLQLAEAVSVGGRFIAVDRGDDDPCASTATKIYASAPGLQQSSMTLTFNINGVSTGASCPGSGGTANPNMVAGANAQITASYPCTIQFFPAYHTSGSKACTLQSSVVEVVQ